MPDQVSLLIEQLAQLKRELRAGEERFRTLITHNADGMLVVDATGAVRYANPAAERLLGRTGDELIGQPFGYPVVVGENTEIDLLRSDKAALIAELRAMNTQWEGQVALVATLRDVTERRRIEKALRDSQLRLALALDAISEGLWDWNLVTGNVYLSPQWLAALGYRPEAVPPDMNYRALLIHPDDQIHASDALRRYLEGATTIYECEYRVRTADGQWRWCLDRGKTVEWGQARQPVRFVGAIVDISERRRAYDALELSERKYRTLAELLPQIVYEANAAGRLTFANRLALSAFGYSETDLERGLNVVDMLVPGDRERALIDIRRVLTDGASSTSEYLAQRSDGSTFPIKICAFSLAQAGVTVGFCGYIADSSEPLPPTEVLRRVDETYRVLIDGLPIGVYRTTPGQQGRILIANASCVRLFGYASEAELLAEPIANLYARPAERQIFSDLLLTQERVTDYEIQLRRKEGAFWWGAVSARVVRDSTGQVAYFESAIQDITARHRAEAIEREQRALVSALRDATEALSGTLNFDEVLDRILVSVGKIMPNDCATVLLLNAERTAAYSARAQSYDLGLPPNGLFLPLDQAANVRYMLETGQPQFIADIREYTGWVRFPELDWVRSHVGAPIRARGQIVGFLNLYSRECSFFNAQHANMLQAFADQAGVALENAQLYDQIDRYAGELEERVAQRTAELERERQRLQLILDSAGEGIVFTDVNGTIEYVNPAMEHLTGYSSAEALGQNPSLWRSGRTPVAVYEQMWQTIMRGEVWRGEMINRHKDGTLYDTAMIVAPLVNSAQQRLGFVGLQRDITRQKELERLKDQFVANVSHELRTPLANVKLYLGLVDKGRVEKRDQYLQTLQREAIRLENLIENLLSISRLDMNQLPIQLVPLNVNELVAQLVLDRTTLITERGLRLNSLPDPDLPLAVSDASLLGQMISNLLTNAMHYTPPGGEIQLSTALHQRRDRSWVTVSVSDTGPGIAAKDMPHLFERFFRGEAGRTSGTPGTGLGLAICLEIARNIGGDITVDSQPGQGAEFTVWLPIARLN